VTAYHCLDTFLSCHPHFGDFISMTRTIRSTVCSHKELSSCKLHCSQERGQPRMQSKCFREVQIVQDKGDCHGSSTAIGDLAGLYKSSPVYSGEGLSIHCLQSPGVHEPFLFLLLVCFGAGH
jgi:hypothetical protein